MKINRHVPWIMGVGSLALGLWFVFASPGFWKIIIGALFVWFGWVSIKIALFASDKEVSELTGEAMSEETKKKLIDRF